MKLCIQGLTRSILLLAVVAVSACGGGTEPVASPPTPFIMASVPAPAKKASTVTGGNGVVIHMYQALYGMAPSNTLLVDYAFQANNDASTFIRNLTDRFATTSHADLAKLVLDNLGVTSTTVPAISAKGESEYGLLLDAVKQLFAAYPTMRGQVILNMTNLLGGLESDATYGAAAAGYNNQAFTNFDYATNPANVSPRQIPVVALFASNPQLLPDLRAKYDALCGNNVSVQNALAANLTGHKDGKKDLIFNLWCSQRPAGLVTTAPTVNGMVAFIQQADGSFVDGTKALFDVDMVNLIGVGIQAVVYDFNNDGYDDIVFAVTGEDGRLEPQGATSNNRQNVFITSKSDGTYLIERLGWFSYNHTIQLVDNEFGGKDVTTKNIGYGGRPSAWRYENGWSEITGYEWENFTTTFFNRKNMNEGSTSAITQSTTNGAIDLFTRKAHSSWTKSSTWGFPNISTVPIITWQFSTGTATMVTLNGKDYMSTTFEQGCELKKKPSEQSIALMVLNTNEVIGGYKGGIVDQSIALKPVAKLMAFSVTSGTLLNIDITINSEVQATQFFKLSCSDVNGDGYDDIVVMPWGRSAVPIIYINDGMGNFNLVDTTKLPLPSTDFQDSTMIYADIDGDGIRDLLYWSLTSLSGNPQQVRYQIYKGQRNINATDMK